MAVVAVAEVFAVVAAEVFVVAVAEAFVVAVSAVLAVLAVLASLFSCWEISGSSSKKIGLFYERRSVSAYRRGTSFFS